MIEIKNARIDSTMLGIEDHGVLTAFIYLDYGGSAQGFGGYAFDEAVPDRPRTRRGSRFGVEFVRSVLEVVGVAKWEDLPGKHVRVRASHDNVESIGHIIHDRWFTPNTLVHHIQLEESDGK